MKYVLALVLALSAAPVFAQSNWSDKGNQSYGQINGQSFNHSQIGNQGYGRIGNQTFVNGSNGQTTCTKIGSQTICN